jgi:parvulin-like peptidyl-prolyl isomerase
MMRRSNPSLGQPLSGPSRKCESTGPRPTALLVAISCFACVFLCWTVPASTAAGLTVDGIACQVNGEFVRIMEVYNVLGKTAPTQEEWDLACHELMVQKLIEKIAGEEGITVTDKQIDEGIARHFQASGLKLDDFKEEMPRYRRDIERILYRHHVLRKKVNIPPLGDDARKLYDENQERFRVEEERHVRIISSLFDEKLEPDAALKAAKTDIEAIMQELKANKDFALIARNMSNDPKAPGGGDWGWLKRGGLIEALANAAFELQVGQTSDIVQSPNGFHIIKVEGRKPGYVRPFEEVEKDIAKELIEERAAKMNKQYLDDLMKNAVIKIYAPHPPKMPRTPKK